MVIQTAAISQDKPAIPNVESLNLDAFENLFSNMSASYKIFWFKALLNVVVQGKKNPTYNELINEKVSEAWVYVNKDKLSLGYSDKLEKLVSYVFANTKLSENAEKEEVLKYMNEAQGIWI